MTDGGTRDAFWQTKSLAEMTLEEWDLLCDGCAKCCLQKLEDVDSGEISYTEVACSMLDIGTCYCRDYVHRTILVPDCVELTPLGLITLKWLPPTCAYRLLNEGKELFPWHPLISGDPESTHKAGVSVRERAISELVAGHLEDHIVDWPEETNAPTEMDEEEA